MRIIKKAMPAVVAGVMGIALLTGISGAKAEETKTIEKGVFIGSIDVGGMTSIEAKTAVNDYVNSIKDTTFTLSGSGGTIESTAQEMGVSADTDAAVEEAMAVGHSGSLITRYKEVTDLKSDNISINMHLSVDKQETAQMLSENAGKISIAAVDNSLERTANGFEFVAGTAGEEVDVVNSVYAINEFLSNEWDGSNNEITLVTTVIEPRGKKEDFDQMTDVLGSFSTDFSSSAAGRAQNVKNGCSKINGTLLYPGEEFSVYKTVSPFSEENGYKLAGSYANGTTVETFGGGICQVSTTLYNAVIRAELEVVMRYNHSMIVGYVPPSADAAIAGEYKDFRFKNNYDTPIYIEGYCDGGVITFNIFGHETRDPGRKVSFESQTLSETNPDPQIRFDSSKTIGYIHTEQSAHRGVVAKLWKIVTVNGVEQSREEFNNSTYNPSPKIVTIGTGSASPEQLSAMQSAAAANDEATVRSIASQGPAPQPEQQQQAPAGNDGSSAGTTQQTQQSQQSQQPQQTQPEQQPEQTPPAQEQTPAPVEATTVQ